MSKKIKSSKACCWHDCKNPIVVDESTYICRSCNEIIPPIHWFFVKQFESMGAKFIDVTPQENESEVKINKKPRKAKLIKTND